MPDGRLQLWIPWDLSNEPPRDQHYLWRIGRLKPGVSIAEGRRRSQSASRASSAASIPPPTPAGASVSARCTPKPSATRARVLWVLLAAVGLVLLVACANVALLSLMRGLDRSGRNRRAAGARRFVRAAAPRVPDRIVAARRCSAASLGVAASPSLDCVRLPRRDRPSAPRRSRARLPRAAVHRWPSRCWRRSSRACRRRGAARAACRSPASRAARCGRPPRRSATCCATPSSSRRWRCRSCCSPARACWCAAFCTCAPPIPGSIRAACSCCRSSSTRRPTARGDARPDLLRHAVRAACRDSGCRRGRWRHVGADQPARAGLRASRVAGGHAGNDTSRERRRRFAWSRPATSRRSGSASPTGAPFDDRDRPTPPRVVMVSETLARRLWPGQRAVGQRLVVDYSTAGTYPYEIVGVVDDVRFRGPRSEPLAEIYLPHAQRSVPDSQCDDAQHGGPADADSRRAPRAEGDRSAEACAWRVSARGSGRCHHRARSAGHAHAAGLCDRRCRPGDHQRLRRAVAARARAVARNRHPHGDGRKPRRR